MKDTTSGRSAAGAGRWSIDGDDPRWLQVGFAVLVVLTLLLGRTDGRPFDLDLGPVLAVVLLAGITTLTLVLPWRRLPWSALATLAVLDVAVVGLARLSPEVNGIGLLLALPALWLGQHGRWRGPLICAVAVTTLVAVPELITLGTDGQNLTRSLLPCIVAVGVASAIAGAGRAIGLEQRMSEAVFDTVDVGLILLDRNGTYLRMNRRHRDFMALAYPDGHAGKAGQTGYVYAADATTPLAREEMPTYRATRGEEFDDHRIWIGKDPAARRALSVSARSVRDEYGELAGAALGYHDVTDFMHALRVKDEFVSSVSHELRTPLTSIAGYVSLLLERDDLSDPVHRQLTAIARNADRLHRLVGDLLHTAQLQDGTLVLDRRPCDLAEIVRGSVSAARPAADRAGVGVELVAPPELPMTADPQRITQVVDNLVSNAVKYSTPGASVLVTAAADGDRVELEVTDTGIGIDAADRDRLFTRFYRGAQSVDHSVPGAGLGLSITKDIVEMHGGRIEVDSQVGVGSVFRIRLPRSPRAPHA